MENDIGVAVGVHVGHEGDLPGGGPGGQDDVLVAGGAAHQPEGAFAGGGVLQDEVDDAVAVEIPAHAAAGGGAEGAVGGAAGGGHLVAQGVIGGVGPGGDAGGRALVVDGGVGEIGNSGARVVGHHRDVLDVVGAVEAPAVGVGVGGAGRVPAVVPAAEVVTDLVGEGDVAGGPDVGGNAHGVGRETGVAVAGVHIGEAGDPGGGVAPDQGDEVGAAGVAGGVELVHHAVAAVLEPGEVVVEIRRLGVAGLHNSDRTQGDGHVAVHVAAVGEGDVRVDGRAHGRTAARVGKGGRGVGHEDIELGRGGEGAALGHGVG